MIHTYHLFLQFGEYKENLSIFNLMNSLLAF